MELKDVTQGWLVAMGGHYSNVLTDVRVSRRAAVGTVTINAMAPVYEHTQNGCSSIVGRSEALEEPCAKRVGSIPTAGMIFAMRQPVYR